MILIPSEKNKSRRKVKIGSQTFKDKFVIWPTTVNTGDTVIFEKVRFTYEYHETSGHFGEGGYEWQCIRKERMLDIEIQDLVNRGY